MKGLISYILILSSSSSSFLPPSINPTPGLFIMPPNKSFHLPHPSTQLILLLNTMNLTDTTTTSSSSTSSSYPPLHNVTPPIILSPCAACKILRRRCVDQCLLAPYFPPTDPLKFTVAHRVFGASNIIKFLQDLPESHRADAVSSMVYEANARIRDPIYGCAGAICKLQKQVTELQAQLARTRADLLHCQTQHANFLELLMASSSMQSPPINQLAVASPTLFYGGDGGDGGLGHGSTIWEDSLWA